MSEMEQEMMRQNARILDQGHYQIGEKEIKLPLNTELYSRREIITSTMSARWQKDREAVLAGRTESAGNIKIIEGDSFSVLQNERLMKALVIDWGGLCQSDGRPQEKGGQTQYLCSRSTLGLFQTAINAGTETSGFYLAPYVDILRDKNGELLKQPWRCAVLSVPETEAVHDGEQEAAVKTVRHILRTAAAFDYDELVWGVWQSESYEVELKALSQVLTAEDWQKYFRCVIFAVRDESPQEEKMCAVREILADSDERSLLESVLACRHLVYFKRYRQKLDEIEHFVRGHEKDHPLRVLMLAALIVDSLTLTPEELETLFAAAAFHDAGRIDGSCDPDHGELSAQWYREHYGENKAVEFLIKYHSLDDEQAYKDLAEYHFADEDEIRLLYCVLKDADALDRVRFKYFGQGALDKRFLRLPRSKELLGVAYKLLQSDLGQ